MLVQYHAEYGGAWTMCASCNLECSDSSGEVLAFLISICSNLQRNDRVLTHIHEHALKQFRLTLSESRKDIQIN